MNPKQREEILSLYESFMLTTVGTPTSDQVAIFATRCAEILTVEEVPMNKLQKKALIADLIWEKETTLDESKRRLLDEQIRQLYCVVYTKQYEKTK